MQNNDYKGFCKEVYNNVFNSTYQALRRKRKTQPAGKAEKDFETAAQKEAIKQSVIKGLKNFPQANAADIWKAIYESMCITKAA